MLLLVVWLCVVLISVFLSRFLFQLCVMFVDRLVCQLLGVFESVIVEFSDCVVLLLCNGWVVVFVLGGRLCSLVLLMLFVLIVIDLENVLIGWVMLMLLMRLWCEGSNVLYLLGLMFVLMFVGVVLCGGRLWVLCNNVFWCLQCVLVFQWVL